jgi:hypothetical protein
VLDTLHVVEREVRTQSDAHYLVRMLRTARPTTASKASL